MEGTYLAVVYAIGSMTDRGADGVGPERRVVTDASGSACVGQLR